jgi:hypothetical protein
MIVISGLLFQMNYPLIKLNKSDSINKILSSIETQSSIMYLTTMNHVYTLQYNSEITYKIQVLALFKQCCSEGALGRSESPIGRT